MAYKKEEEYWARKSRMEWLQQRDKKTKYFNVAIGERMRRNRIDRLIFQGGAECEGDQKVAQKISKYFLNLFVTSNPCDGNDILGEIQRKVTNTMNLSGQ